MLLIIVYPHIKLRRVSLSSFCLICLVRDNNSGLPATRILMMFDDSEEDGQNTESADSLCQIEEDLEESVSVTADEP